MFTARRAPLASDTVAPAANAIKPRSVALSRGFPRTHDGTARLPPVPLEEVHAVCLLLTYPGVRGTRCLPLPSCTAPMCPAPPCPGLGLCKAGELGGIQAPGARPGLGSAGAWRAAYSFPSLDRHLLQQQESTGACGACVSRY